MTTRRITGKIMYDDNSIEDYWFDIPIAYEPSLSGNLWLACLLPLAATIGEDLEIALPVDRELLIGANSILKLWKYWRPDSHVVNILVDSITEFPPRSQSNASFFSAGVDSFFSVLQRPDVTNWITVLGFDMPIEKEEEFQIHCRRLSTIASDLGKNHISVRTNLRRTRWRLAQWEALAFGPALASVALVFEDYFYEVLIPASCDYAGMDPWGSHPLSDPLFSTCGTRIVHEGAAFSRFEKIEYLVKSDRVLRELHVCFRGNDSMGQDHQNCCRCEKCYRTMIALDILGKLECCTLFDSSLFSIKNVSKIFIAHKVDEKFFLNLQSEAVKHGRRDLAEQIGKALLRSRVILIINHLRRLPFFWRFATSFSSYLLRDSPK
jgi:hypothetical protein